MRNFLSFLRRLGGDDQAAAIRSEGARLAAATQRPAVDPRFRAEMLEAGQHPQDRLHLGTAARDPGLSVSLPLSDLVGTGHTLVLGGSGAGKTRAVAGIARQLLLRIAYEPEAPGLWLVDHKSEFTSLMKDILGNIVDELPSPLANRLLDKFVVINPFSRDALVPMQVLKPEPGVDPELQAYEVTTLVNRLGGAELGVKQDDYTYHFLLLLILLGRSLPEGAVLLSDPVAVQAAATSCPSPGVRAFFAGRARVPAASIDGVRARLNRLLRAPSLKLMFEAKESVSFRSLLASKVVFIDLGSPPLGTEDLGRFMSGLMMLKLTRAIFERSREEAARPVLALVDEWQEGVSAGGDMAEHYERVLSMARSKGVSFALVSQSMALAAKVSSSLPEVVATNCDLQLLFKASSKDAHGMAHMLPVSGKRMRPPPAPWEDRPKSPYFGRDEELRALVAEVPSLPRRTFYLWNRRRQYPAELVRAMDVEPSSAPARSAAVARRLEHGVLARSIEELEAEARGPGPSFFRPVSPSPRGVLVGRPRRPRGR